MRVFRDDPVREVREAERALGPGGLAFVRNSHSFARASCFCNSPSAKLSPKLEAMEEAIKCT